MNVLLSQNETKWPIRETFYLHSNKEPFIMFGEKHGLAREPLNNFRQALYEVKITLDVYEDGTYSIVEHDLDRLSTHKEPEPEIAPEPVIKKSLVK